MGRVSQQWGGQGGQPWEQQGRQPWGQQWGQPQFGQTSPGWAPPGASGNQWGSPQQGQQQWGAQQQWGGQPGWAPPGPPKKSGGLGKVLLIAGGLVVAAVLGLVIWNLTQPQYRNDNYEIPPVASEPPPLPVNENPAEWEGILRQNVLYQQTVDTPVRCELEPERLDPNATPEQVEDYLQQEMDCLYRVWGPVLDRTGKYQTFVPKVTVYTDTITTDCGTFKKAPNAFYCSGDQRLYLSMDLLHSPRLSAAGTHPGVDFAIAHEYAHLLQGRVEILTSSHLSARTQPEAQGLETNRRGELQADCLAGMYVASVAQSRGYGGAEIAVIMELTQQLGDDTGGRTDPGDHGTTASRQYWAQLGMSTTEVGKCNTYVAPPDLVR